MSVTEAEFLRFPALTWQDLADELLFAIDRLEAINSSRKLSAIHQAILITVADDLQSLHLVWHSPDGEESEVASQSLQLCFPLLPTFTDIARDDETEVPNASIDRAVSKAAAEMLSWSKDPENCELLEQRRYQLFLCWPDETPAPVNEYAYGIWDE